MTCDHPTVWRLAADARGVLWPTACPLASTDGPAWCPTCGAFRGTIDGKWHLPESARVQVVVAPPSPHRIQSTGGDHPVFPEFRPLAD